MEWVLIATLALTSSSHTVRDISPIIVPGFASQINCESAARQITESIERLASSMRQSQGLSSSSPISKPQVMTDCIVLRK